MPAMTTGPILTTMGSNTDHSDLVSSIPAPLLRILVLFARPIVYLRVTLEVLYWKAGRRVDSWMVVGVWWGLCLGSTHAFRWLLPPLIFLPLVPLSSLRLGSRTSPPKPSAANPTTQEALLLTLSDLHAIHALLPPSPIPIIESIFARFKLLGPLRLIRGLLVIWTSWIVLGRLLGFRSLLAILGTIILLLPSPFLAHVFNLLSRSLIIRRSLALAFLFTFGSPPDHAYPLSHHFSPVGWVKSKWATSRRPSLAFTFRPKTPPTDTHTNPINESAVADEDEDDQTKACEPIYFRFEVHENQRWWMGLDWTSALLPQERPSWCDSHLLPVSPPASFPLPPSSSIILSSPTKTEPNVRVKRIATWRWLDDDWSIVRAGPAAGHVATAPPVPISSPTIPEEDGALTAASSSRSIASFATSPNHAPQLEDATSPGSRAPSIAEQAFAKGLERLKVRTGTPATTAKPGAQTMGASPSRSSGDFRRDRRESDASRDTEVTQGSTSGAPQVPTEMIVEKDDATDADGWVYGDNKWEGAGPKGGLGRFTRRRRWHRRAVLTETIHRLPPDSELPSSDSAPMQDVQEQPHQTPFKSPPSIAPASNTDSAEVSRPISDRPPGSPEMTSTRRMAHERHDSDTTFGPVKGPTTIVPPANSGNQGISRDDALRMRLKKAMGNVGG